MIALPLALVETGFAVVGSNVALLPWHPFLLLNATSILAR
jgi:uncharacterized membrane protein YbaN (DUF454 family)